MSKFVILHKKTTDFAQNSSCHRTTIAHFLNSGKWDDTLLESTLKSSVVEILNIFCKHFQKHLNLTPCAISKLIRIFHKNDRHSYISRKQRSIRCYSFFKRIALTVIPDHPRINPIYILPVGPKVNYSLFQIFPDLVEIPLDRCICMEIR